MRCDRGRSVLSSKSADHFFWPDVSRCDRSLPRDDPDSWTYVGVGAFQLLKRSAYEAAVRTGG